MANLTDIKQRMPIHRLLSSLEQRKPPVVFEHSTIRDVIDAMIQFEHSRVVYVVNEAGALTGTISLGTLSRHVFSRSHETQIHARLLMNVITTSTAKDMMQKHPVFAMAEDEVGDVLKKMVDSSVKEIPILDGDRRVIGDVTLIDLLKFVLAGEELSDTRSHRDS